MREIKFRAWENPDNSVSFLWSMHYWNDVLFYLHKWVSNPYYEIMQYTVLKDWAWKEIYEGDIIEWIVYWEPKIWIVKWSNNWLRIIEWNSIQDYYFPAFKIIWNIYENPTLVHDTIIKNLPF